MNKFSKRKLLVERLEHRVLMTATLGFADPAESPLGRYVEMGWASQAEVASFDMAFFAPSSIDAPSVLAPEVAFESISSSFGVNDSFGSTSGLGNSFDFGVGGFDFGGGGFDFGGGGFGVGGFGVGGFDFGGGGLDFGGGGFDPGDMDTDPDTGSTLVDAPVDWESREASRTVTQWIDGVFHRWDEYDVVGTSSFFVVSTRPEQKPLSAEEAADLMVRSSSWLHMVPEPIDPSLYSTADAAEFARLTPDQPNYLSQYDASGGRTVLGTDDRVRVPFSSLQIAPWYNVGFQSNTYPTNQSFRCTAFAVAPNVVLTNGHCVFNSARGGYVTSAQFTPGQFQASAGALVERPFGGPYNAVAWETNPDYLTDPLDAAAHDYAAMFFENGFDTLGIGTFVPLVFNAVPTEVEIIGYPGMAQGESTLTMWTDTGSASIGADNRVLTYTADSSGGNSGGPIWQWVNGSPRVVGIHAFGSTNFNGGPRLSSHNLDIIEDWLLWTPEGDGEDIGDSLVSAEPTLLGPSSGFYSIDTELGDGLHEALDVDLFQFSATAGSTVSIETSIIFGGVSVDTVLRLFDAAGNELALNDDSTGLYSLINYVITETGTYYVGVSGFPNLQYSPSISGSGIAGSEGDYRLSITLSEPAVDNAPLVGVDFGVAGSSTPVNWSSYSGGSVQYAMIDLIDESGAATQIDLYIRTLNSTDMLFSDSSTPSANLVPNHTQSLGAIGGNIFAAADVEFLWSNLTPDETYEIYVFGSDTVDFSADYIIYGGEDPYTFNQTVTANSLNINGQIGDSSRSLHSYAIVVAADAMGQIRIESSRVTNFVGLAGLAIRPGEPLPPEGGISGFKWSDLNGDGIWDAGEPGLADWEIYIDGNNNGQLDAGELSTTTGADGSYQFVGLLPGIYTVAEVMRADWVQTFPGPDPSLVRGASKGESLTNDPNANDPKFDPAVAAERLRWVAEQVKDNPNYRVDDSGNILVTNPYFVQSETDTSLEDDEIDVRFPLSETFFLNSVPGANKTVYLDFNGHTTINTLWNSQITSNAPIVTTPYSLDADPNFSNAELTQIQQIWEMVAEDFRPFNINVTTQEPSLAGLVNSGGGDNQWGIRVVFGPNNWFGPAGGVAYVGSFNWSNDTPTFVFNTGVVFAAEAATHEVGHTLGLIHDGRTGEEYYEGHGSGPTGWAPIMGVGYYRQLVQWSRGEYPDASNQENDLQVIVSNNGFGYRIDDHGGTIANASILETTPSPAPGFFEVADEGIIERNTDVDYFVFTTGAGLVNLNIRPFYRSPNLDILANLYNDSGLIASSNPVNSLDASFQLDLPAGTYYLTIQGTGKAANGGDFGYSDYGSLGYYSITGTLVALALPGTHLVLVVDRMVNDINFGNHFEDTLPGEIRGFKWHDVNEDGVWDVSEPALEGWTIYLDENENGQLDDGETFTVTGPDGSYAFTDLMPGTYFVGEVMQAGWAQTFPDFESTDSGTPVGSGGAGSGSASGSGNLRNGKGDFSADSSGKNDPIERGTGMTLVNTTGDLTGLTNNSISLVSMALRRAAELSQYSQQQLSETRQWVIVADPTALPGQLAEIVGGDLVSNVPMIDHSYLIEFEQGYDVQSVVSAWNAVPGISVFFPLVTDQKSRRLIPNDPLFGNQWHLLNTGQSGGTPGADSRATVAWDRYLGEGVVIAVIDDGLEHSHPDLAGRYRSELSFDFNGNDPDPTPTSNFDNHGTAVAGVAAATGNNGVGVSGVAPQASLAGIRLIAGPMTDLMEALALSLHSQDIDIYNNSWGPFDTGAIGSGSRPGPLTLAALEAGVNDGRGGLGSIFVWAGGNGQGSDDNVNYDGYANSRFTLAVGAIDHRGIQSSYSEPGAPLIISAYSSGDTSGITTTDLVANGSYTDGFGGTSSSAPLVAGVVALMLEANPNLGWRDVQNILIDSATQNDPTDSDWVVNGAGRLVNHKYGFGAVDAAAAVDLAEGWSNLGPEVSASSGALIVGQSIPDNNIAGVSASFTFDAAINVEYVEIVFDATHTFRGDLTVVLTSPSGTQSILAETRFGDNGQDYESWVFTSARHWGEAAAGDWTVTVSDRLGFDVGTWDSWQINIHGTSSETSFGGFHEVVLASGQVLTDINFGNRTIADSAPMDSDPMAGNLAGSRSFSMQVSADSVPISSSKGATLQYEGLSDLQLQFSEPIERFTQNYVDLRGIKLLNYNPLITNITYDQTLQRGVIQLRESISNDRLMLLVAPNLTDLGGNSLGSNSTGTSGDMLSRLFGALLSDATRNINAIGSDSQLIWQHLSNGQMAVKYQTSSSTSPHFSDDLDDFRRAEIEHAVFSDLDVQWDEQLDAVEMLEM